MYAWGTDRQSERIHRQDHHCHSQSQDGARATPTGTSARNSERTHSPRREELRSFLFPEEDQQEETANQTGESESRERGIGSPLALTVDPSTLASSHSGRNHRNTGDEAGDRRGMRRCGRSEPQPSTSMGWMYGCGGHCTNNVNNEAPVRQGNRVRLPHRSGDQGLVCELIHAATESQAGDGLPGGARQVFPHVWLYGSYAPRPDDPNHSRSSLDGFRGRQEHREEERGAPFSSCGTAENENINRSSHADAVVENIDEDMSAPAAPSSSSSSTVVPLTFMDVEHPTSEDSLHLESDQQHTGTGELRGQQVPENDSMAQASPDEEEPEMTNFLELVNHREDRSSHRRQPSQAGTGRSFRDGLSSKSKSC